MAEMPTILLIKSRTGHAWMEEEVASRMTEEFATIIEDVEQMVLKAGDNDDMAPVSMVWFIAKELYEQFQRMDTETED